MSESSGLPLEGVRILAVEQMQAMPFGTQLLARMGADVVKVEHPTRGESGRASAPSITDVDGRSLRLQTLLLCSKDSETLIYWYAGLRLLDVAGATASRLSSLNT